MPALRLIFGEVFANLFAEIFLDAEEDDDESEPARLLEAALLTLDFLGAEYIGLTKTEQNSDINRVGIKINVKLV